MKFSKKHAFTFHSIAGVKNSQKSCKSKDSSKKYAFAFHSIASVKIPQKSVPSHFTQPEFNPKPPKPNCKVMFDSNARPQRTAPLSNFGGGRPYLDRI